MTRRTVYWCRVLDGIYDATSRSSHASRRFWIRVRNHIPWFFWSY